MYLNITPSLDKRYYRNVILMVGFVFLSFHCFIGKHIWHPLLLYGIFSIILSSTQTWMYVGRNYWALFEGLNDRKWPLESWSKWVHIKKSLNDNRINEFNYYIYILLSSNTFYIAIIEMAHPCGLWIIVWFFSKVHLLSLA